MHVAECRLSESSYKRTKTVETVIGDEISHGIVDLSFLPDLILDYASGLIH